MSPVDPATLYGPNDHRFEFSRDESGVIRLNKDGQPVSVVTLPGLGPEVDAILLRESPRARAALLDAREAELQAQAEALAAVRRDLERELASLPKSVRDRLQTAAASGE
jgi:hypothetical protein